MPEIANPAIERSDASTPEMASTPIGADEFANVLSRLGPFENRPRLAVAVSGGRDSMALTLLTAGWAQALGGEMVAVSVDHGLREGSPWEAAQVSKWLASHGIMHHTLTWTGTPGPGVLGMGASEATAREVRYTLLEEFCRERGILHLLIGHHRDDQAETQAMRRARGSGVIGSAGMPAVRELGHVRILRPLLSFARKRTTATLVARDQPWIDDPSNVDPRFTRARMRLDHSGTPDIDISAATARQGFERELAALAARAVMLHPAGFALLDPGFLLGVKSGLAKQLISNLVTCVGGAVYPPRGASLTRLCSLVMDGLVGRGLTLGGCVIRSGPVGRILFARELAGIAPPKAITVTEGNASSVLWDGRFRVSVSNAGPLLGAVGQFIHGGAKEEDSLLGYGVLPHAVRMSLPAVGLCDRFRVCALPDMPGKVKSRPKAHFAPAFAVAGTIFALP
ncbi:MAG TPA: tRNA lysidine(34) synthetase TilS [Rhodospirillaceae bacterium]|nr:tRNA lysidine(34) synthetase TilS [Rhodospirillaceae bacterium]